MHFREYLSKRIWGLKGARVCWWNAWTLTLWGKALACSPCQFPGCQYSHWGRCRGTKVGKQSMEWERDAHDWFSIQCKQAPARCWNGETVRCHKQRRYTTGPRLKEIKFSSVYQKNILFQGLTEGKGNCCYLLKWDFNSSGKIIMDNQKLTA